jgi:hypothetical protein
MFGLINQNHRTFPDFCLFEILESLLQSITEKMASRTLRLRPITSSAKDGEAKFLRAANQPSQELNHLPMSSYAISSRYYSDVVASRPRSPRGETPMEPDQELCMVLCT